MLKKIIIIIIIIKESTIQSISKVKNNQELMWGPGWKEVGLILIPHGLIKQTLMTWINLI
jgi:hypothetical protein